MSTIASTQPVGVPAEPAEAPPFAAALPGPGRLVFRGVDWHTYNQLSEALDEGEHVRLVYDGKDLEIVVVGNVHGILKDLIGKIVSALAMGLGVNHLGVGSTTWKTAVRGLEADLSYCFDPEKIRAAHEALRRRSKNPADYPRPDMAIEIDMSPPRVDRPAIYRDLGVAEVWRFIQGEKLVIEQLQPDGTYAAVEESRFLRVRPEEVLRWLNVEATEEQVAWQRRLNEWALALARQAPGNSS